MAKEQFEEKIIISVNVLKHLDNIKNMNIKNFLTYLDTVEFKNDTNKEMVRELYLDNFNGYHREVKRLFHQLMDNG